jgi:hypothetical protein
MPDEAATAPPAFYTKAGGFLFTYIKIRKEKAPTNMPGLRIVAICRKRTRQRRTLPGHR